MSAHHVNARNAVTSLKAIEQNGATATELPTEEILAMPATTTVSARRLEAVLDDQFLPAPDRSVLHAEGEIPNLGGADARGGKASRLDAIAQENLAESDLVSLACLSSKPQVQLNKKVTIQSEQTADAIRE